MDLRRLLLAIATLTFAISCSSTTAPTETDASTDAGTDSGEDPDSAPTGDCKTVTNVSDGPTTDEVIAAGATTIICYYAQPSEGYCRKITSSASIANYLKGNDKGAIGCKDAVILAGPECPTKNAVGKCDANSIDAQRVYYKCTKFPDPAAHCAQITGTYTAL